jgi:hypothetical protein
METVSQGTFLACLMDDDSFGPNFNVGNKNDIQHQGWKQRLGISSIAKFRRKML